MVLRAMGPGNRGLAHRLAGEETYAAAIPDADSHQNVELQIVGFAPRFAPRQQVYADHGSNLRIARPQATIIEGASTSSFFGLSLIHISEPTRRTPISYAVFCLKK